MTRKAVAVVIALAAALTATLLGGCFGPSDEQIIRDGLNEEFSAIADSESEARQQIVDSMGLENGISDWGVEPQEFVDSLFDGFAYEIGGITVDSEQGTAEAQVTLTNKSAEGVVTGLQNSLSELLESSEVLAMTQGEIAEKMGELIMESVENAPLEENELTLPCVREGEDWTIDDSAEDALYEAMVGQLAEADMTTE